jgi:co-chaperonin GroES (HSP10)
MTVDGIGLVPNPVSRLAEKETAKGGIVIIPSGAEQKQEENEILDIEGVGEEQWTTLDNRTDGRTFSGIQIDDEGYLIIREEETPRNAQWNRQRGIRE